MLDLELENTQAVESIPNGLGLWSFAGDGLNFPQTRTHRQFRHIHSVDEFPRVALDECSLVGPLPLRVCLKVRNSS